MKNILTFLVLLIAVNVSAQYHFPKKELCEELEKRTLAIQLLDVFDDTDKNLNKSLKEAFAENWKLTPVKFVTEEEVEKIRKEKNTQYALLTQEKAVSKDTRSGYIDANGRRSNVMGGGVGSSKYTYTAFQFSYYNFDLILTTNKKEKVVTNIGFANGDLSKIDYTYLVQQLSKLIKNSLAETPMNEYYNVKRNIAKCKKYNLAILEDFIKDKEKEKIGELYPHKYELIDFDKYQDIILDKIAGNGYVKIIWSNQHRMCLWVVVDAENGDIISQMGFGGVKFGKSHDANDIIKVKHLKHILNETGQKMNNKYK